MKEFFVTLSFAVLFAIVAVESVPLHPKRSLVHVLNQHSANSDRDDCHHSPRCDFKVTDELESRFSDALDVLGEPSLSPSGALHQVDADKLEGHRHKRIPTGMNILLGSDFLDNQGNLPSDEDIIKRRKRTIVFSDNHPELK